MTRKRPDRLTPQAEALTVRSDDDADSRIPTLSDVRKSRRARTPAGSAGRPVGNSKPVARRVPGLPRIGAWWLRITLPPSVCLWGKALEGPVFGGIGNA